MTDFRPTTRIVAFLDILGFKEKTQAALNDPEILKQIDRSFLAAQDIVGNNHDFIVDTRMFSDSICCSAEFEPNNVWKFLYTIEALQMNLACLGFFLRGGIAVGNHYENERMIVSQALIDAYDLESRAARYPRIVASLETLDLISISLEQACEQDQLDGMRFSIINDISSHFRKDKDGEMFLSYLMSLRRIDRVSIIDQYIGSHKDSVLRWLSDGKARDLPRRQREKHEWLRDYHNLMISELFSCQIGVADEFIIIR